MRRAEKTVFISYRRTNFFCALAIFQDLSHNGYDVFFDFTGIAGGDFETVILENIKARAHFVVLLTPSALERCGEPGDWLRREIETALEYRRNIVPLMLENFDFSAPGIANQLTGDLEVVKSYNGLRIVPEYFAEGMGRLRDKFLNVPLDAVLHPASRSAKRVAEDERSAAASEPAVQEKALTATEWFERGFNASDPDEKLSCYGEAIRRNSDYADAFNNRGNLRYRKGDPEGALRDLNEALRLRPDDAVILFNRGVVLYDKGDVDGALKDFDKTVTLKPNDADAFYSRGNVRRVKGDRVGAAADLQRYLDLAGLQDDNGEQTKVERIIRNLKMGMLVKSPSAA